MNNPPTFNDERDRFCYYLATPLLRDYLPRRDVFDLCKQAWNEAERRICRDRDFYKTAVHMQARRITTISVAAEDLLDALAGLDTSNAEQKAHRRLGQLEDALWTSIDKNPKENHVPWDDFRIAFRQAREGVIMSEWWIDPEDRHAAHSLEDLVAGLPEAMAEAVKKRAFKVVPEAAFNHIEQENEMLRKQIENIVREDNGGG